MKKVRSSMIDILFTLALFCVFSATALGVTLIGSRVYQNSAFAMENHFNSTTAISYVKEKMHQHDHEGAVKVEIVEGKQVLILNSSLEGYELKTMIYEQDGFLKELYVLKDSSVGLDGGQNVVPIENFQVEEIEEGLFRICITGMDHLEKTILIGMQANGGD